ncbi:PorP/SprF family type IX secretion system membrane protein [Pedobacter sp. MR2016-24]|uniref:PorP/SprF family type IX secretion system membrane protein n=1 Tax=Pedobacter sp. MR2016-24 TaxID=2994466 RepID=UPI0022457680|nr:PorP/SprF family type IX secretion system membrane protein [Pedobacter sp. MR2016-24]MCX2486112.1 PorP/SprF family type IX secretion system membrane protein [Pedobacter sp. MR2016-24]
MTRIYAVLFIFLLGGSNLTFAQQQFTYTQYIDNVVPMNPAWSLTRGGSEVNILGRKQWMNVEGAPSTFMANGFTSIDNINATVGFNLLSDKVAVENLTEFSLFFAKAVRLDDELYLSAAMNAGFRRYNAAYSALDPDDPTLVNSDIRENKGSIGAAVMIYIPGKFYAGVSLPRLSFEDLGTGSVNRVANYKNFYFFNIGYTHALTDEFSWDNAAVMAYTANVPLQADFSSKIWVKDALGLGFNYRTNNELGVLTSFKTGNLNIGYSYQFGFGQSKVAGFNGATHEITIGLRFGGGYSDDLRVRK